MGSVFGVFSHVIAAFIRAFCRILFSSSSSVDSFASCSQLANLLNFFGNFGSFFGSIGFFGWPLLIGCELLSGGCSLVQFACGLLACRGL